MAFKPVRQYSVSATTTASTALALAQPGGLDANDARQVQLYADKDGSDIVVKFGDSTVEADDTVTSGAYAAGNFTVPAGALFLVTVEKSQTHVSAITAAGTGTLLVQVGFGEKI